MTDQEHAAIIGSLTAKLNGAIFEARNEGLNVEVDLVEIKLFNERKPRQMITVTVLRTITG